MTRVARGTLAVCVAVLLVSCASDDRPNSSSPDVDTTAVPATTAPTVASADESPAPAESTDDADDADDADDTTASTEAANTAAPATPSVPATDPAAAPTGRVLVDFAEPDSIDGWSPVNDTVMGGVSSSTVTWESGQLVFAGDLSLDNNGGFTSVRSPRDASFGATIGDASAITVDATGDGKTYVLQLRTSVGTQYIARFTTVAGERQPFVVPLADFVGVSQFLEPLTDAEPLDPATVDQLTVYLLDKQQGPFRLAIAAITAG